MSRKFCISTLLLPLMIPALLSCDGGRSAAILPADKMAEVLYDVQVAQELARESVPGDGAQMLKYRQAALYKHQIDDERFQLSFAHYLRNKAEMKEVYQYLQSYQTQQSKLAGGQPTDGVARDTLSIWERKALVLDVMSNNSFTHTLTTTHGSRNGQKLCLSFNTRWLNQFGNRPLWVSVATADGKQQLQDTTYIVNAYQSAQLLELSLTAAKAPKSIRLEMRISAQNPELTQVVSLDNVQLFLTQPQEKQKLSKNPANEQGR